MSNKLHFNVTLTFESGITDDNDIIEVANNIARAIIAETNGEGIAPQNGDTYLESVSVNPDFTNLVITETVPGLRNPRVNKLNAIKAAKSCLRGDDDSIERQIQSIAKYPNQKCYIDDAHGVDVLEPVRYKVTCESFLEMIGW